MIERRHYYYQISMKLISPMLIGCGKNENTDNDVLRGMDGRPYIPATCIVGVLRHMQDSSSADAVFGNLDSQSPVMLFDAAAKGEVFISERENVALDEYKVVKRTATQGTYAGAKFKYETVQPGAVFVSVAEIPADNESAATAFEELLKKASVDGLCFGAKTTRGLGEVKLTVRKKSFNLENKAELNLWLDFDPFAPDAFSDIKEPMELTTHTATEKLHIDLSLRQVGGLSIRYYTGEIGSNNEASVKNSPMLVRAEAKPEEIINSGYAYVCDPSTPYDASLPVVPGTSWAGAFRHRFLELTGDEGLTRNVFGFVDNNSSAAETEDPIRSLITFSETVLHFGKPKQLTRIAVDRFSGAVKDRALLTEESVFDGEGELRLRIDRNIGKKALCALCAVLSDLNLGYLAVGGETAIGRGLFKITSIRVDDKPVASIAFESIKEAILNACS